ncbi:rhomboid family intramembrane serine protease [Marinomonas flavescens]|uniref:rhomboid family intramembrane serine protease n=1 Tax=Marinomonas flavescens TaxID=2529379 RepID=UPI0010560CB0|nr:rhomboid family intramembrane serine protease [Marinomonas flavescens]
MYLVYQFDTSDDPALLSETLWRLKISHQIIVKGAHKELWVPDPSYQDAVLQLIQIWKHDPASLSSVKRNRDPRSSSNSSSLINQLRDAPATFFVILAAVIVAIITQLGSDLTTVSYFTISPLTVIGNQIRFFPLSEVISQGEYWRLISPALLHFSVMHIAFNALWVWDVGRRLEKIIGSFFWLLGVLIIAVASNILQFEISPNPLFGGLSGVVYGLIGFAWFMPMVNRSWPVIIHKPLMIFFMVWLAIGYTPLTEMIGLGSIANTAHSIGLISGLALGIVYWFITKLYSLRKV